MSNSYYAIEAYVAAELGLNEKNGFIPKKDPDMDSKRKAKCEEVYKQLTDSLAALSPLSAELYVAGMRLFPMLINKTLGRVNKACCAYTS